MTHVRRFLPILIALSLLPAAGCAKSSEANGKNAPSPSPSAKTLQKDPAAQLTFATYLPLADFKKQIQDPIAAKYQNIKLTYQGLTNPNDLNKLVKANKIPDIILDVDRVFIDLAGSTALNFDLNTLAKESKMDLTQFDPDILKRMQQFGQKGELYSLPYSRVGFALFYNKGVFDQFGTAYPKDDMTWNQVMDLSKKFSQPLNGVAYRGFDPMGSLSITVLDQRSLQFLDPKTDQPNVTTPAWKEAATLLRSIYAASPITANNINKREFSTGKTAMTLGTDLGILLDAAKNKQNVDMVSYPTDPKLPGVGPGSRISTLSITQACKDKNAAFQVLSYLVSEPAQLAASRAGKAPVLKNKDLTSQFSQDIPEAKGKNTGAFFRNKLAAPPAGGISKYESYAIEPTSKSFSQLALDTRDIDAILNEMQETLKTTVTNAKKAEAAAAGSPAPSTSASAQPAK